MEEAPPETERMRLVIDTNILIAAFLKASITRRLLLHPHIQAFTADYSLEEFFYYQPLILKKAKYSKEYFEGLSQIILPKIKILPEEAYEKKIETATRMIGGVDEKDIPLLALALTITNDGIWTYDHHFNAVKDRIKIWNTKELAQYIFGE